MSKIAKANTYACLIIGSLLFIYVVLRAQMLSFTIDESFSYLYLVKHNIKGLIHNFNTNAHILNSIGMVIFGLIFGKSELVLRMPNVLAYLLFLIYSYKLIKLIANEKYLIFYFIIFNSNPFLLDFFSLARGYGLSAGFITVSLYHLLAFFKSPDALIRTRYVNKALLFGGLSVLSNLTSFYYFIPLAGILILIKLVDRKKNYDFKISSFAIVFTLFILAFNLGLGLYFSSRDMLFGGKYGFIDNVTKPLINCSFILHHKNLNLETLSFIKVAVFGITIVVFISSFIYVIYDSIKSKKVDYKIAILFILLFSILIPVVQHKLLDSHLPFKRTALFYLPIYLTMLIILLQWLSSMSSKFGRIINVVVLSITCLLLSANFAANINFYKTYTWYFNADVEMMMEDFQHEISSEKETSFGVHWVQSKAINYYIHRYNLNLKTHRIVNTDDEEIDQYFDYYYIEKRHLPLMKIPEENWEIIKEYPRTQTVLIKLAS